MDFSADRVNVRGGLNFDAPSLGRKDPDGAFWWALKFGETKKAIT
jgi:hypothetical protein